MPSIGDATSITRADLLRFPKPTADIILSLQKNGWRVSINKNTHARLLAPDGVTIVGATTNKNSHVYLQQQVLKYNAGEPIEKPAKPAPSEKVRCPRPDCGKWFSDLDHLNIHINVDHENMTKCPDCDYTHRLARIVMIHRSKSHGYESPSKANRLKAAAKRKLKQQDHEAVEAVASRVEYEHRLNDELCATRIMDEAEILSIEPIGLRTETRRQSYTSDALELKSVPPASDEVAALYEAVAANRPEPVVAPSAPDLPWNKVIIDPVYGRTIGELQKIYEAAGLEMELRVRSKN